jgi:hypothetical protein
MDHDGILSAVIRTLNGAGGRSSFTGILYGNRLLMKTLIVYDGRQTGMNLENMASMTLAT